MPSEALLPCPFCGGKAELWKAYPGDAVRPKGTAFVGCMGECATVVTHGFEADAEAIATWNRRAAHQERDADASCVWTCDEDGNWDTACGGMFILIADTPKQNGMNYCCYCGRTLAEADGTAPDTQTPNTED